MGEVPKGWKRVPLGEIASEVRDRFDPDEEPQLPYVGLANVEPERRRIPDFGRLEDVTSTKTRFCSGDVLFGKLRPYLHKVAQADRDGGASTDLLVVRPKNGLNQDFLYWRLTSGSVVKYATRHSAGTKMPRTSWRRLSELIIPVPPVVEQRQIAAILSSVDDAIAATRKVIEQTKRVKKGLLQTLMTRGIGHTRFKKTELGEIPEEWEVCRLEEVCGQKITYGIVQCGPHVEGGVPYVRVSDMAEPELRVGGMLRTSHEIAARYDRSRLDHGDIVYALRGSIGEVRLAHEAVVGANLTQGTARLSPSDNISSEFLLWVLRSPRMLHEMERRSKGTTFKEITLSDLRRVAIPVPARREQDRIAERLSAVDVCVRNQTRVSDALVSLKRGIMQDLLTGRVRATT